MATKGEIQRAEQIILICRNQWLEPKKGFERAGGGLRVNREQLIRKTDAR